MKIQQHPLFAFLCPYLHVMPVRCSIAYYMSLYACLDSQFARHSSDIWGFRQHVKKKKKRFARNMPIQDHANRIALLDLNFDMPLAPAY